MNRDGIDGREPAFLKKSLMDHANQPATSRQYMIALHKWRSGVAFAACTVTLVCAVYAIVAGMLLYTAQGYHPSELFRFFTTDANILTAAAAGMIIPFTVEGYRRKQFTYPKWLALVHYAGTICVTLTMVCAVGLISWFDRELAFGGYNIFLHIVCPVMVLVSFFLVESDRKISCKEALLCLLPFAVYAMVYTAEVALIGEQNGGWPDFYQAMVYMPAGVSFVLLVVAALAVSFGIRKVYNSLTDRRERRMMAHWDPAAAPVEIKIEVFGLGRYRGLHGDDRAALPLDIFRMLTERYGLTEEELARAYLRGLLDGRAERKERKAQ